MSDLSVEAPQIQIIPQGSLKEYNSPVIVVDKAPPEKPDSKFGMGAAAAAALAAVTLGGILIWRGKNLGGLTKSLETTAGKTAPAAGEKAPTTLAGKLINSAEHLETEAAQALLSGNLNLANTKFGKSIAKSLAATVKSVKEGGNFGSAPGQVIQGLEHNLTNLEKAFGEKAGDYSTITKLRAMVGDLKAAQGVENGLDQAGIISIYRQYIPKFAKP